MIPLYCTTIVCLTVLVVVLIALRYMHYSRIVLDRERWDRLLNKYVDIAYEVVYSKYVLPFVASQVTFPVSDKDKYFVEASQVFLAVLQQQLGKNINIYYEIYKGKSNFVDVVLSMFVSRLQEDMVKQVIENNVQLTLQQNETNKS